MNVKSDDLKSLMKSRRTFVISLLIKAAYVTPAIATFAAPSDASAQPVTPMGKCPTTGMGMIPPPC